MSWVKGISPRTLHEQFGLYRGKWNSELDRCWEDFERGYSVCSRMIYTKQFGNIEHVTITKHNLEGGSLIPTGGEMAIGWKEKMMIKNELFGEDRFAIEVYPKQENLIDSSDVYHLWVFNKKYDMPFGIHPREYKKAINRGDAKLTMDELKALETEMEKHKPKDSEKIDNSVLGMLEMFSGGNND